MSQVVVLNASYEPLNVVTIHRAVVYLVKERADVVAAVPGRIYRAASGEEFPVPAVVRLRKMIKVPYFYKELPFSREALFARDSLRCGYCDRQLRKSEATIDHVLPKSRGGRLEFRNTVTACSTCNGRKRDRLPEEAGMKLLFDPKPVFRRDRLLIAIAETGADLAELGFT